MNQSLKWTLFFLVVWMPLTGCKKEAIQTYTVSSKPAGRLTQSWHDVPKGWTQKPVSGMRLGSFEVPPDGQLTIIALEGQAGGLVANINRWRGQLGLRPISDQTPPDQGIEETILGGYPVNIIFLAQENQGMLVGIMTLNSKHIFYKLTASVKTLHQEKQAFKQFIDKNPIRSL